jgi:Ni/Co efflux regulator RcnB
MKSLLIAAMIATGGIAAAAVPAQAASVVITTDNGMYRDRGHHRDYDRDYHRHHHWRRHHERNCWVKVRRYWHHGERVIRRERVCE